MEASKGLAALLLVAGVTMALMDSAGAYVFYAGGKDGWVQHPSESYGDWAERNRFQVADTIVFKYKKGEDSVLVVGKQDYDACDVSKPIQKLDGGDSVFKFDRSGPFFFISGAPGNCQQGSEAGGGGHGCEELSAHLVSSIPPSVATSYFQAPCFISFTCTSIPWSCPTPISETPSSDPSTIRSSRARVSSSYILGRRRFWSWDISGTSSLRTGLLRVLLLVRIELVPGDGAAAHGSRCSLLR
ncbi:unnamed protein product, partial [Musa textilis]